MDLSVIVRSFIAIYLVLFGIGFMFVRTEDTRLMLGALFAAIGLTVILRIFHALYRR